MSWRAVLAAALIGLVFAPWPAAAQNQGVLRSDILVIDPERLFEDSKLGQQMLAEHQGKRDALSETNRQLVAELEAEEQRLTDMRPDMSPEEFRVLADEFDARVQRIRADFERRARDLERDRERLPVTFLGRVDAIVLELMRASGGVVLLDQRSVILRADAIDITDRAIARIDAVLTPNGQPPSADNPPDDAADDP